VKVLVTGGTGVIGRGLIPALLKSGHDVTLLSRHASRECAEWPAPIRGLDADIAERDSLRGTLEGIDCVVHVAGIIAEEPPGRTYQRIHVEGTRHLVEEAERSGVRRLIAVSSLGADRGRSPYHVSKRQAEEEVRRFSREWVIVRPGNVYGPGDDVFCRFLRMVRAYPAVPQVGRGNQRFQPIWFEDLGVALTRCVADGTVAGKTLELAGDEILTPHKLLEHFQNLTRRPVPAIWLPAFFVRLGQRLLDALQAVLRWIGLRTSVAPPINESQLTMLLEENLVRRPEGPRLADLLDRPPTPVQEGLRRLVDELPELPPSRGVGALQNKVFWADLDGVRPEEAVERFRRDVAEIMPIDFCAEPGASDLVAPGQTFTAHLPVRGHIQIRVEVNEPTEIVFMTVEGHPLAGIVRFSAGPRPARSRRSKPNNALPTRFQIEVFAKAGSLPDWLAEQTFAWVLQNQMWKGVLKRLVKAIGQPDAAIQMTSHVLEGERAQEVERQADELLARRQREERAKLLESDGPDHVERAHRPCPLVPKEGPAE